MKPTESPEDRALAWLGDAALALVVREWILETEGVLNGELHRRLTSNDFLRQFGHPTLVEASLGKLYQEDGLEAVRTRFREVILARFLQRK